MIHRLPYIVRATRACVAVAAAYALALQVLLLSVLASGMAMAPQSDAFVICYGSGAADDGKSPPSHSSAGFADCTLTCAQGLGSAAILPSGVLPAFVFAIGDPVEHGSAAAFVLSPRPSPRLAQGPPQSA
jgi:hypothetical protein